METDEKSINSVSPGVSKKLALLLTLIKIRIQFYTESIMRQQIWDVLFQNKLPKSKSGAIPLTCDKLDYSLIIKCLVSLIEKLHFGAY